MQTALLQKVTIGGAVGKVLPPGPPVERAAEILQSPSALSVLDVYCSGDRVSPIALLILLFPVGLEYKLGGDRRVGVERIPRPGHWRCLAPRFALIFFWQNRPEGKRVFADLGRALGVFNDSVFFKR